MKGTQDLSLHYFLQLYVSLQLSQQKKFNKKVSFLTRKNVDFTHCPNAFFLFEKNNLKAVPLGKASLIIMYMEINRNSQPSTKIHASVTPVQ